MNTKISIKNTFIYVLGFLTVGLGINIMKKSTLGLGAWDTVTFNIHDYFIRVVGFNAEIFLVGYVSAVIAIIIMIAVLLYRRRLKYLYMLVPILLMTFVINFWYYLVFDGIVITALYLQIIFFIIGTILLPLGLSLVIASTYPAFVFDEFTFVLTDIFHIKKFATSRLIIEFTGIFIGSIFGYLIYTSGYIPVDPEPALKLLGSVGIGSFIVMFSIGPTINFFLNVFKVKREEQVKND